MHAKSIFLAVIAILATMGFTEGGSPCPPRENIYPCFCHSVPLSKKLTFTTVTCRHLQNTDSLVRIFGELRQMQIDQFIMYDSFWHVDDDVNKKLPSNWFSQLRIKDLHIVDSELSRDIGCDNRMGCPNNVPTHLQIVNSSSTDEFVTFCETTGFAFSWISCMSRLQHFEFVNNKLKAISKDFFAKPMRELLVANFSHNLINNVDQDAFVNLPKLSKLDLSHNMLSDVKNGIFGKKQTALIHLDLSWNLIKVLSPDLFSLTPHLKYFAATNNRISKLPYDHWKGLSQEIRTLDLIGNPIECDCHMIWLNCTLKTSVLVYGYCSNEEYENTPLRRVAKFMSERCENGELMERENKTKKNACKDGSWQKSSMLPLSLHAPKPVILFNKEKEIDNNLRKIPEVSDGTPRRTRNRNSEHLP